MTTKPHIVEATRSGESVFFLTCLSQRRSIDVWVGDEPLGQADFRTLQ
jgi:hypothetical protein